MSESTQQVSFSSFIEKVKAFHDAFGIQNSQHPSKELSTKESLLRYKLMREENEEYLEACQNNDIVEIADALGDQLYILCGTLLQHGLQHKITAIFEEIHRSNMSKLDPQGNPVYRSDGKVMKSHCYSAPQLQPILKDQNS